MKRSIILVGVLALLALDWAALHDIMRGEPDVRAEWVALLLSLLLLGALRIMKLRERRARGAR